MPTVFGKKFNQNNNYHHIMKLSIIKKFKYLSRKKYKCLRTGKNFPNVNLLVGILNLGSNFCLKKNKAKRNKKSKLVHFLAHAG